MCISSLSVRCSFIGVLAKLIMTQTIACAGTVTSSSAATIRDREYYPTQNRNPIIPVPTSPSPYMQGPGSARGVYCNRPAPHLAATSHPSMRSLPIYLGNQAIVPSRQHSRPLATTGRNEDQRERFGNPYEVVFLSSPSLFVRLKVKVFRDSFNYKLFWNRPLGMPSTCALLIVNFKNWS